MLEFFTYKKVKKHREEKAEKQKLKKEDKQNEKGKEKENNGKDKVTEDAPKPSAEVSHSESSSSPEIVLETAEGTPILDKEDEKFLERLTSPSDTHFDDDDETPPPLPPRIKTPVIELDDSDASSFASRDEIKSNKAEASSTKDDSKSKEKEKGKDKDKDKHDSDKTKDKQKRFSFVTNLSRGMSLKRKPDHKHHKDGKNQDQDKNHLSVPSASTGLDSDEARKEEEELAQVLSGLDLVASAEDDGKSDKKDGKDGKKGKESFSLSRESAETLRRFTQVLKDLANGVPTAYQDLMSLIEDRDGALAKSYEKLPRSLRKLVAKLPDKLTSSLAPELLAVAAEAQGLEAGEEATKKLLSAGNLLELVTKPGAVAGLLKGIVNALKVRWPAAMMGTNMLWSVAVFLLLSALWYCYKRGRETRLEKEAADAAADGAAVVEVEIEEVDDEGKGKKDEVDGSTKLIEAPEQNKSQPTVSVSGPEASEGKK